MSQTKSVLKRDLNLGPNAGVVTNTNKCLKIRRLKGTGSVWVRKNLKSKYTLKNDSQSMVKSVFEKKFIRSQGKAKNIC